jgi:hypothetical protein
VLFIDKRGEDTLAGIYALDVDGTAPPRKRFEDVALYTEDYEYRVDQGRDRTVITRLSDGQTFTVPAGGRPVALSPDNTRVVWQVSDPNAQFERRVSTVWASNLDGSDARRIASLPRGGVTAWLDDDRLLVTYRSSLNAEEDILGILHLDGTLEERLKGTRLRGTLLSPDAHRLAYYVTGDPEPGANGLWVLTLEGGEPVRLPGALFGGFRWRDDHRLVIAPMEHGAASHRFVEYDARSGASRPLTDPGALSFEIANGDWEMSPDGTRIVFVSARDDAIWLLELEGAP